MKFFIIFIIFNTLHFAFAIEKINMNFNNEDLTKVIETYAKGTGQKFIIDPSVRGKVTIQLPEPALPEEAFNHLSSALALNGFAISTQGDTMIIKPARIIQRDFIEVSRQKPSLKPERMYTWIVDLKNISVESLFRELRIIQSRDGEVAVNSSSNQLIITDWVSNINRVANLIAEIDKPIDPKIIKIIEANKRAQLVDKRIQTEKIPIEKKQQDTRAVKD